MSKEAKKLGPGYERHERDDRPYEEDPLVELARIVSGGPLYPRRNNPAPQQAASDNEAPEDDAPEASDSVAPSDGPQPTAREPEDDVFAGDPTADLERELLAEFEASFSPPEPEPYSPEERAPAPEVEEAAQEWSAPAEADEPAPAEDFSADDPATPDVADDRAEPSLEADEAEDQIAGYPLDAAVPEPVAPDDDIAEETVPEIELPGEDETPTAETDAPEVFAEPDTADAEASGSEGFEVGPAEPDTGESETVEAEAKEPERPEPLDLASQLSAILGTRVTPTTARPGANRDEPSEPAIEGGSASLLARMRRGFEETTPHREPSVQDEPVARDEPVAEDEAPAVTAAEDPETDIAPPVETASRDEEPAETAAPEIDLDDLEGALAAAVGEAIANDPEISQPRFEPSFADEPPADLDLTPLPETPDPTVDETEADDAPEVITEAPSAEDDIAWKGPDVRSDSRYDEDDDADYAEEDRIEPGLGVDVAADDSSIEAVEAALFPEVTSGEPYRIDERYAPEPDVPEAPEEPDVAETAAEPEEGDAYPEVYAAAPADAASYEESYDADGYPVAAEARDGEEGPAAYAEDGAEGEADYPVEGYADVEGYEDGADDDREFVPREYRSDAYDPAFDDAALEPPRVAVDLDEAYGAPVAAGYETDRYAEDYPAEAYHGEAGYAPDGDYSDSDDIALAAEEAAPQYSGDDQLPPHTEEELEASPADGDRGRGMMVAAVIGGIVVLGLAGFLGYRFLAGDEASGPPPMIYADTGEVKVKPEEPQGTGEPERSKLIYDRVGGTGEPGEERLIVRTEEPVDPLATEGETGVPEAEARGAVPRRVRTVVVRPDGTIVDQSDEEAPAAAAPVDTVRIRPTTDDIGATADEAAEGTDTAEADDTDLLAGNADAPEVSGEADVPRPKPGTELAALDTGETSLEDTEPVETSDDVVSAADEEAAGEPDTAEDAATADEASDAAGTEVASREPAPRQIQTEAPASRPATPAVPRNARRPEARPATPDSPVSPTARRVTTQPVRTQGRDVPPTNRGASGPLDLTAAARAPAVTPPPSAPPANAAEAAAATPATAATPAGTYSVQVSSQRSEAQAQEAYKSLQSRYPQLFNNQNAMILRADLGDKGTYYRVRVGPMDRGEANSFCTNLKSAGGDCFIRRN
ncbi:SPOR domain-containing protein [Rhodobium gokarnense]|uniref:SPOR domain-containing protein n=1 Tax=Rhodobium gokarnense TaxID=364296 RepID=A0ABT3HFN3_9HYPH|nr:SPOR domain-containing protein [Rhodobium gokarnense]MCW2309202.1 hypothetical protein [Rhodobium gokarnense]